MVESKVIPTDTIVTSNNSDVTIYTFFSRTEYDCDGNTGYTDESYIKESFLPDYIGYKNGIPFLEGELLISSDNTPILVDYWLDNDGNLIIKGANCNSYYIDDNGYLIFDICDSICPQDDYVECGYVDDDYV